MSLMLEIVVPTDYYIDLSYPEFKGSKLDDYLTLIKVGITDEYLNCMTMEEFVEFIGIDSEFVVSTNWEDLM